jgi:hypothetical protein
MGDMFRYDPDSIVKFRLLEHWLTCAGPSPRTDVRVCGADYS